MKKGQIIFGLLAIILFVGFVLIIVTTIVTWRNTMNKCRDFCNSNNMLLEEGNIIGESYCYKIVNHVRINYPITWCDNLKKDEVCFIDNT